jgi:hypothetical protein
LAVGDKVVCGYHPKEHKIVRKIVEIAYDASCGSGVIACADGGEPCKCCGRTGKIIYGVGADWFVKVKL